MGGEIPEVSSLFYTVHIPCSADHEVTYTPPVLRLRLNKVKEILTALALIQAIRMKKFLLL